MGDLVEPAGLLGAVLLAIGATLALRAGVRLGLGGWPRLAATAAPLALAAPAFAFATFSARAGLSGGALGAAAGGFAGIAATGALTAWTGSHEKARGASTLAACAGLAAAAVMVIGFDGRITMAEGRLMLLFAVAILLVSWRGRAEAAAAARAPAVALHGAPPLLAGLALAVVGAVVLTAAAWAAVAEVGPLAGRRADGDLELGLTALGLGVCLPSLVVAWRAARRGEGGAAFVECAGAAALGLAGGLGSAALVAPITISEAFLTWPAVGLCLGAAALVAMAGARPRPAPRLRVMGGIVYAGLLAAFARSAG
jgi:cation:H+ antiporter